MSFTNLLFLFVFLPAALGIYYSSTGSVREYVLLVISLVFYAFGSLQYFELFLLATVITVALGRSIGKVKNPIMKKLLLLFGIAFNLGLLLYYKYADFAISIWNRAAGTEKSFLWLALPLGISFFTFKAISYLVDVYQGKANLTDNPVHDLLYLSFFTQVISGPLSRYNELDKNMIVTERIGGGASTFADGVYRFMVGFGKKVLIADLLGRITEEVFGQALTFEPFSTSFAWLGSVSFSLQLLFDFAGYSDMAIGLSEMFGYRCPENFLYPYMTDSIGKFWRRWHVSLSQWFRDYVYIPLGGSRTKRRAQVYFNLFAVWLLTGLWHGAAWSFIAWGLGYFVMIALERALGIPVRFHSRTAKILYRIFSLFFINCQWVLFRAGSLSRGLIYLKYMLVPQHHELCDARAGILLRNYGVYLAAAVILCFPIVPWIEGKLENRKTALAIFHTFLGILVFCSFMTALSFVVSGLNNPFAYANF